MVQLDHVRQMSVFMADCHGDGKLVFNKLNELHENTPDLPTAHCTFLAMVRIRILEQRILELQAELQHLQVVARDCY